MGSRTTSPLRRARASIWTQTSAPEAAPIVSHDYYDTRTKRADCQAAYSLRTQGQLDKYRQVGEVKVNYDPQMDAARWQWIKDDESADQIRVPIRLDRPTSGTSRVLIVSDHRWDTGWFTEFKDSRGIPIGGWKWLQFTSMTALGIRSCAFGLSRRCVGWATITG